MAQRPNILLVTTDQQRHDTVSCLGHRWVPTPHLDRLATDGVACAEATTPCPVCMPARWSVLTGRYPGGHGCRSNHHPGPRPAQHLPGLLRAAGYRTGLVGKNHTFLADGDLDLLDEHPVPADAAAAAARRAWARDPRHARLGREPAAGGVAGDPDVARTDAALRFLAEQRDRPFFLWLSYLAPHTPYHVPDPYHARFAAAHVPPPAVEADGLARKPFRQRFHRANNDAIAPMDADEVIAMRRTYAAMVALIDDQIGRLLAHLDGTGLADDTLVVFTSDHGDYMGDHGLLTKSPALYDCLVRVPLIIRSPRAVPGGRVDRSHVSLVDLMPTLLAAAGISLPELCDGEDLWPALCNGGPLADRETAYAEYGLPEPAYGDARLAAEGIAPGDFRNPWNERVPWEGNPVALAGRIRMRRGHDWKYIADDGGTGELYHLAEDPNELHNLIDDPAAVGVLADYRERLGSPRKRW